VLKDKADGAPTLWQFQDMNNLQPGNPCFQNNAEVLGVCPRILFNILMAHLNGIQILNL